MRTAWLVAGLVLCMSLSALAQQTPLVEVAAGYSFLRDQEFVVYNGIKENFHGWLASVAGNFNRWLGITGEIGGNYKSLHPFGIDVDLSLHSYLVGPRFSARQARNVTPFGQFLLGAWRGRANVSGLVEPETSTEFALQPGGGVDLWLRPHFGIRIGGDYRRLLIGEYGDTNEFRFHIGGVVSAGVR